MKLDQSAKRVLAALSQGAEPDLHDLARRAGLAPAVVEDRYQRLRQAGAVPLPKSTLDPKWRPRPVVHLVLAVPGPTTDHHALARLTAAPDVQCVMALATGFSFQVEATDDESARTRAEELCREAGMERWSTTLVVRFLRA